jgi:hypothetical protein
MNGLIRNPVRLLQLNKISEKYTIDINLSPNNLSYFNGWFAGLLDSDGTITYNHGNSQIA